MELAKPNIDQLGPLGVSKHNQLRARDASNRQHEELRQAAEEFEAIFAGQMLSQARQTKLADDLFGSKGSDTFRSMLDQEYSREFANNASLGIAEAPVQQLSPKINSGGAR